jgi:hypothetical protein
MVLIDQLAEAALAGDGLRLRTLTHDWHRENPDMELSSPPISTDQRIRTVAAALVELFAQRAGQIPPSWTAEIGAMSTPTYLLKSATTMRRLREQCEEESPPPLRRRKLYAPADFLTFA